jgi:hypothetical protein
MNVKTDRESKKSKEPYEKPALRKIELVTEEVMALGCKFGQGFGPQPPTCPTVQCLKNGS